MTPPQNSRMDSAGVKGQLLRGVRMREVPLGLDDGSLHEYDLRLPPNVVA